MKKILLVLLSVLYKVYLLNADFTRATTSNGLNGLVI